MGVSHSAHYYAAQAARDGVDLTQVHCIVTGASSGIGLEAARVLAEGGAHVVMACRNVSKANKCIETMHGEGDFKKNLSVMQVDLESFASVKTFAAEYLATGKPLNLLVCNAGYFMMSHETTADGYEKTFQTCHLSHYLMFRLLQDKLVASAPSRVVMVASAVYRAAPSNWDWPDAAKDHRGFGSASMAGFPAYGQAKLANILMAQHIAETLGPKGVRAFALHPGGVDTSIYPWWTKPLMKAILLSPGQGAAPTLLCAVSKQAASGDAAEAPYYEAGASGYTAPARTALTRFALNKDNMRRLAQESETIVKAYL